ncbi:GNAT family N-acetyltransferase [Nocardia huaxiensis]|uniref:GNAT family N-acetyltransferase n=1 Tax=Nocardia huaxiensis TaxID=2755382 RepID=A0A7D6VD96_9NOCA|nr:GNAT family N-acetyltransferase [Nocardia huaxiensis]QLY31722.1 GNAT family N-acetyltransferase [Nocardia huaxiensis]UFS95280.1 GNAT family N-acetyltransferase [Nocardia huaxiensis]
MEVRGFAEADRKGLWELYKRAGAGSPVASLWGDPESEAAIYLNPYLDLEPESVFVAVVDGELAGYLAGCLDGAALPGENERIEQAIRAHRLFLRRKPAAFFGRAMLDSAVAAVRRQPTSGEFIDPRWPAHLHIAVAREARGTGAAEALMRRWFERLDGNGSPGCHLQTQVENVRAVRFFTRMGFSAIGERPVIPGMRFQGKRVHQQTMVRPESVG